MNMSRKNRNSGSRKYTPKIYAPDYLAPIPIDKLIAEAKRSEMKPTAVPERIMCDDSCSYEHKRLPARFLETDFSCQRKIDTARVDRMSVRDRSDARHCLNNYPRKIFDYKSANEAFAECLCNI